MKKENDEFNNAIQRAIRTHIVRHELAAIDLRYIMLRLPHRPKETCFFNPNDLYFLFMKGCFCLN